MAGYWPILFFAFLKTETKSRSKKSRKRTRLISSHLDRTSLVNAREFIFSWLKRYRIQCIAKDFALIRIQNDLFISRAESESQLFL